MELKCCPETFEKMETEYNEKFVRDQSYLLALVVLWAAVQFFSITRTYPYRWVTQKQYWHIAPQWYRNMHTRWVRGTGPRVLARTAGAAAAAAPPKSAVCAIKADGACAGLCRSTG